MGAPEGKTLREVDSSIILNRLDSCIEIAKENADRAFRLESCGGSGAAGENPKCPVADFTGAVNEKLDELTAILEDTRASLRRFI
jgi:hypothetical protein